MIKGILSGADFWKKMFCEVIVKGIWYRLSELWYCMLLVHLLGILLSGLKFCSIQDLEFCICNQFWSSNKFKKNAKQVSVQHLVRIVLSFLFVVYSLWWIGYILGPGHFIMESVSQKLQLCHFKELFQSSRPFSYLLFGFCCKIEGNLRWAAGSEIAEPI